MNNPFVPGLRNAFDVPHRLPPTGPPPRLGHPRFVIGALVAVHVLLDVVLGLLADSRWPNLRSIPFVSLMFAQTSLLGIWAGLGLQHFIVRLIGVGVGTLYLIFAFGLGVDELNEDTAFVFSLAVGVITVTCWCVRHLRGGLQQIGEFSAGTREGLQFTIRQFMLLTVVVALLISIAKMLQPLIPRGSELVLLSTFALSFALVGLFSLWAMLGSGIPALRCPVVLVASAASAWILAIVAGPSEWRDLLTVKLLEAAWLLGTLWIVRAADTDWYVGHLHTPLRLQRDQVGELGGGATGAVELELDVVPGSWKADLLVVSNDQSGPHRLSLAYRGSDP